MTDLLIAGGCLALVLSLLGLERFAIDRIRARIPLRIAVTGTRGKTSVVRLIAAGRWFADLGQDHRIGGTGHPSGWYRGTGTAAGCPHTP